MCYDSDGHTIPCLYLQPRQKRESVSCETLVASAVQPFETTGVRGDRLNQKYILNRGIPRGKQGQQKLQ